MNLFGTLFIFIFFLIQLSLAEQCLRFCVIHLSTIHYTFKKNLFGLNPQYCSHLILDAYSETEIDNELLRKTLLSLRKSKNFLPNIKVLIFVGYNDQKMNSSSTFLKLSKKFKVDGFYFDWRDGRYIEYSFCGKLTQSSLIKDCLKNTLVSFRQNFNDKIIVTTIGPKNFNEGYYDLKIFNQTVNYVAIDAEEEIQYLHMQNFSGVKEFIPNDNETMSYLANALINNGIPKNKLLIYADGPDITTESRVRVIWSSLNNFTNLLIDNMQNFNNHLYDANEKNDDIEKLEKLHVCPSSNFENKKTQKNLTCYFSLKDDESYHKISKEIYQKCNRIIFQKLSSNYSSNNSKNLQKIIQYFHDLNLTTTKLFVSVKNDYCHFTDVDRYQKFNNILSSKIVDLIKFYNLNGIELICDDLINAENLKELITKIKAKMSKEIEIGLQVNVFKVEEKLVVIMNNDVSWVSHKINPLSDAALAIFYQWHFLHENYELDLQKVVIKISPGIWQQNAIFSFLGKSAVMEQENPEDDIILNRKFLCLNETIKQNLPSPGSFLNLPIIFTIHDDPEKWKEKMLKRVRDPNLIMAVLTFNGFGKSLPRDAFYMRYETKEIIQYKIKVAEKYGFGGGFAISSINDDDFGKNCGTSSSLFEDLVELVK